MLEAIERVNRELGTTTAVITHNAVIAAMSMTARSITTGLGAAGVEAAPGLSLASALALLAFPAGVTSTLSLAS